MEYEPSIKDATSASRPRNTMLITCFPETRGAVEKSHHQPRLQFSIPKLRHWRGEAYYTKESNKHCVANSRKHCVHWISCGQCFLELGSAWLCEKGHTFMIKSECLHFY